MDFVDSKLEMRKGKTLLKQKSVAECLEIKEEYNVISRKYNKKKKNQNYILLGKTILLHYKSYTRLYIHIK